MYDKKYNSGHKNNYNRNNDDRPKNLKVSIPVSFYGITMNGKEYDSLSFIDIMSNLQNNGTFNMINIPVYMKASYINDKPEAKWTIAVGNIKEFDDDSGNATCIINSKGISAFQKIADPVIVPRVAIKQGKCACIIALDIIDSTEIKKC